jgi:hypothetical protein
MLSPLPMYPFNRCLSMTCPNYFATAHPERRTAAQARHSDGLHRIQRREAGRPRRGGLASF